MKAKDLMIGDWIRCRTKLHGECLCRVADIETSHDAVWVNDGKAYGRAHETEITPIPLTHEILEKNGWCYNDENAKFAPETWSGGGLILQGHEDSGFMIMVTSDYDDEDTNHTPFILNYVHELQHALMLRRINKKITL